MAAEAVLMARMDWVLPPPADHGEDRVRALQWRGGHGLRPGMLGPPAASGPAKASLAPQIAATAARMSQFSNAGVSFPTVQHGARHTCRTGVL